jgi:hypothetical protein
MKNILIDHIKRNNTTNLGRSLTVEQQAQVVKLTGFLKNPRNFNERVYCIINNIEQQPLDVFGNPARFVNINRGYSFKVDTAVKQLKGAVADLKKRRKILDKLIVQNLKSESNKLDGHKTAQQLIVQFKKRNRRRNAQLYQSGKVEGIDYVVCPVSNERMSMIKTSYIEHVLSMSVAEYDLLYPGTRGVSKARKKNIKKGLHKVDPVTGKTAYQISQEKSMKKLLQTDSTGLTGYQRKGQRTRATHLSKIDEFGRNGYQRQVDYRITTLLPNGLTVEQNAHRKQKDSLIKNKKSGTGGASKLSKKVLAPIIELLNQHKIKYYFDKTEYGIKDTETNNYYFWDLTIPTFEMVIEYQSLAWHADPSLNEDKWNLWTPPRGKKKTAAEVLEYDYNKARSIYKHRKFVTYYVWQRSQDKDVEELLCLLKTLITKS